MNCTISRGEVQSRLSSPPATNCTMRRSCCATFYCNDDGGEGNRAAWHGNARKERTENLEGSEACPEIALINKLFG